MSGLISASVRRKSPFRRQVIAPLLSGCSASLSCNRARTFSRTIPAAHHHDKLPPSPLGPIEVEAALRAASGPSFKPRQTLLQDELFLSGRAAVVTGGQRGQGLEMAEALAEAGAAVYCLDLPSEPDEAFTATKAYVSKLGLGRGARLEYTSVDVTNQKAIWEVVDKIANEEDHMDVCIAAADVINSQPCLSITPKGLQKVMDVNVNGVVFTAQAAGRQMVKLGTPGSIIMIASMAGSLGYGHSDWAAYGRASIEENSSKYHLGGYIYTKMTGKYLDKAPHVMEQWLAENPLGRTGRPDELRGLVAWLASGASSFCTGSDIMITGGHHAW